MELKKELYRKSLHLLLILIPLIYHELGKSKSLMIFLPVSVLVITFDYLRRKNPQIRVIFGKIFGPVLRNHEISGNEFCGASWVAMAVCVNFFLFKAEIAVTAFVMLVICDTVAALIGKRFVSQPFFEKSLFGSLAFFVSGVVVLFSCGMVFDSRKLFYFFGLIALFCTTIIEARPSLISVDDNFTIPISFAAIMTFFDLMWNFSN